MNLANISSRLIAVAVGSVVSFAAVSASAVTYTDGFIDPSWQGDANSTYQEWYGGFTKTGFAASGPNAPTVVSNSAYSATPTPNANAGSPVGFITSTGGIYSFSASVQPTVTVPNLNLGSEYNTIVRWQVAIDRIGEYLDLNTVTITPTGGTAIGLAPGIEWVDRVYNETTAEWEYPTVETTTSGTGTYQDLGLFEGIAAGYGEGPDYTKGYLFEWILPGNAAGYTLQVLAGGHSLSFKGTQVDTIAIPVSAVPEPGTLSVLGIAVAGLLRRHRRM